MISTRKLIKMARKWQKFAVMQRKRISFPGRSSGEEDNGRMSSVAAKGHFVAYTADERRFVLPLPYLSTPIFGKLLQASEEEFGLSRDGPITLPCDAIFMDYIISLICRCPPTDFQEALLTSVTAAGCCGFSSQNEWCNQQLLVC